MDKELSIQQIALNYPMPITYKEWETIKESPKTDLNTCYCVGGAFCLYAGKNVLFPCPQELIELFEDLLPELGKNQELCRDLALNIINANDREDFRLAWEYLEFALNYGKR